MKGGRQGKHTKETPLEIQASRGDTYEQFVKRAAQKYNLKAVSGKEISLFKMNGARILNETIAVDKNEKPWTLGNYLRMLKKSAATVKIGVGYVKTAVVIDLSKEQVCLYFTLSNFYRNIFFVINSVCCALWMLTKIKKK